MLNEFGYFFETQKTVMKWPRKQSAKECLKAKIESGTAGSFLNRFGSNLAHEIGIEYIMVCIY